MKRSLRIRCCRGEYVCISFSCTNHFMFCGLCQFVNVLIGTFAESATCTSQVLLLFPLMKS